MSNSTRGALEKSNRDLADLLELFCCRVSTYISIHFDRYTIYEILSFAFDVDIICFFAEHGVWPAYPLTMQDNVVEMGQTILSQDDEYIRTYCRGKLKPFSNLKLGKSH